ncbi:hypothetical protein VC83_06731 [Pseudogymnoascus destructans]|uniref:DUF7082 domain-containing protein n=1 Tax=Pseudogymnoascus destructans TaxID=655981 RepID=A0A177A580_9PEZI|nr:uncharacterized protein VC83_06731 [Pseudogymnoascus destructans]OAF56243.1 hypothetical protein VC83_06731 [Pseudogymnoascus destructans]
MSAFGKPPPPHLQGFDASRSFSDPAYAYPAAPHHASQPPPHASPFQNAPEMVQVSYGSHATRGSYDEQQAGSYAPFNSNPTPASIRVTSRQPPRGLPGSKLDVYVASVYEIMTTSLESVFLLFGQQKCQASLMRYEQQSRDYQYIVSTDVPQIAVEAWESAEVPLFLLIENAEGELMEKVDVGPFTYERGRLGSDAESLKSTERSSSLVMKPHEDFSTYSYLPSDNYSPQVQYGAYEGIHSQQFGRGNSMYQPSPPGRGMYQYSSGSPSSVIKVRSNQIPTWTSYRNGSSEGHHNQGMPGRTSLPSISPSPLLVRTSTIDQNRNNAGVPMNASGSYYHQAMHPLAVILNLHNDLDSMGRLNTWSTEEIQSRRRILQFKRSQAGNTINLRVKPVMPEERQQHSICISCILWEDKNQCFVTSVDTIYLLEYIMAQKFQTEEKNRIRRNLEHFKPLTVKKPIPDKYDETNAFFTAIMGFPQPKPRNIEKDIKVFAWKSLSNALRKITSKYSVKSGSSQPQASLPPPTLLTPASSTGYNDNSTTATYGQPDRNGMFSPRSSTRSMSGASTHPPPYAGIPARLNSPPYNHLNPIKGDINNSSSALPNLPLFADTTTNHSSHGAGTGAQWSASTQHHMPAPLQQYTPRSSWDLTAAAAGGYADPAAQAQGSAIGVAVTAAGGMPSVLQRPPTTQMPLSPLRSRGGLDEVGGGAKEERRGSLQALRS